MAKLRSIRSLVNTPRHRRDEDWLRDTLQTAICLEMATIPPYLCALWSIKSKSGDVYDELKRISVEEMKHMGLACNLLGAFGGRPKINRRWAVPKYPGPLPGGVHEGLEVALQPLSKVAIGTFFMQIEFPHPDTVTTYGARGIPTIGHFYRTLREAVESIAISITQNHQVDRADKGIRVIRTRDDALAAIDRIALEGEGGSASPFSVPGILAHYYQFAAFFWERQIVECETGGWGFCGDPLPFPPDSDIFPMAIVPKKGYPRHPEAVAFDREYTAVLDLLQRAWDTSTGGDSPDLDTAITRMSHPTDPNALGQIARRLMSTPRPTRPDNYGPCFRIVR